jgi:enamine deaminase RidA (YjgF/YER057c/UK114 family)
MSPDIELIRELTEALRQAKRSVDSRCKQIGLTMPVQKVIDDAIVSGEHALKNYGA